MHSSYWWKLTRMLMLSMGIAMLLSLAPLTQAAAHHKYEIHEQRNIHPTGWQKGERLDQQTILPVRIGLRQRNLDNIDHLLLQVSDPQSSNYGQHWSIDQVQSAFAPSKETREIVSQWLWSSGIALDRLGHDKGSGGWISFDATVAELETLFQTQYYRWTHPQAKNGAFQPAVAHSYSLPSHIRPHVDFITPTLHFDAKLDRKNNNFLKREIKTDRSSSSPSEKEVHKRHRRIKSHLRIGSKLSPAVIKHLSHDAALESKADYLSICSEVITPDCLRVLYNIPKLSYKTKVSSKNTFAVAGYSPNMYLTSDLKAFFGNYSTHQVQSKPTFVSIDGGGNHYNNVAAPEYYGEATLDLSYSMTLLNPIPISIYQVGDGIENPSFNDLLDAFDASYCKGDDYSVDTKYPDPASGGYKGKKKCGGLTPAKIISTSYGFNEADLTPAYVKRQCHEYAKLGLLGTTFLYSSGDNGVGGNNGGQCINPQGGNYTDGSYGKFNPSFPATCPYVLTVGATQVNPDSTVYEPESACNQTIYSGGGFSNVFQTPSYQTNAIKSYYTKDDAPSYTAATYNNSRSTRGFPDISANGANYDLKMLGDEYLVYGTSASTPVVASILSLINEARFKAGKSSLGFINPALYANPAMLNDITSGNNPGCGTEGFTAVEGWDPVTGLGTPNYTKMLQYFLKN